MKSGSLKIWLLLLLLGASCFGAFHGFYIPTAAERADMPKGMIALSQPPVQKPVTISESTSIKGYTVTKFADYVVTARILGTHRYRIGDGSDLSPLDLALGWGVMADRRVYRKLHISQSARYYEWRLPDEDTFDADIITLSSANTHIIPANDAIRKKLLSLHKGQVVALGGALVGVSRPDGFSWSTSMTRQDKGPGACELMLVDRIAVY